jgi:hypothetical protein
VSARSSATAVDLSGTSFAVQQDTGLNVRGAEAFCEHFDVFPEAYGRRGADERDPYHHRWREKPAKVITAPGPRPDLERRDA